MPGSLLWLGVDGWPWAVVLAAKVSTGKTFRKPVEHYLERYPFWDAVAWAVQAVDTPCTPRQGYEGVLEHVVVRFVARCSRICTHELVRHRLASYSQTSTRLGGFHATGYAEAVAAFCRGERSLEELCVIPPPGDAGGPQGSPPMRPPDAPPARGSKEEAREKPKPLPQGTPSPAAISEPGNPSPIARLMGGKRVNE